MKSTLIQACLDIMIIIKRGMVNNTPNKTNGRKELEYARRE